MSNKDIDIKILTYYLLNDIINIKFFNGNNIKIGEKVIQKYSYLLFWICNDKKFEI